MPFPIHHPLPFRHFVRAACLTVVLLVAPISSDAQQMAPGNTLMPEPAQMRSCEGWLPISSQLTVSLDGPGNPLLRDAVLRMLTRLEAQTGVQLERETGVAGSGLIEVKVQDNRTQRPTLGVDETYSLSVQNGKVRLEAKTVFGAMHGLETLLQLVEARGGTFGFPCFQMEDAPRFPWRGLMLDPGRHFLSVDQVLRTLDGMASVKMNVLHWHLTEDQGFRIESLRYPLLHQRGSEGDYYTQDQVREIVRYATARGIRVIPEFDMPGHSLSWMVGYPELGSQPGPYHVSHENRIAESVMDPTRESTYQFLDNFIGEMATLFPDEYLHIGGDESKGKEWRENPQIVHFMETHGLKSTQALQAYFNSRLQGLLKKHGKQMVGWDEILSPDLSPDVVIQNWHGPEFLVNAARQHHKGLLSQPYYLDQMYLTGDMYLADPIPAGSNLSAAESKLILGGEACMWGEQVNSVTADSRIWPATAAVAERFWSPASVRDVDDMYRRLEVMSGRLDGMGLTHISGPQRGLRQMAGGEVGAEQLAVLASVLQPVSFEERSSAQHTSPLTPLDHMIDFTRPDPPARHRISLLVSDYLQDKDPAGRAEQRRVLEAPFRSWIEAGPALDRLAATNPFVAEISTRREQLPRLGRLGVEALESIETHRKPSPEWVSSEEMLLKQAAEHTELTDFVCLDPLRALVQAAAHQ